MIQKLMGGALVFFGCAGAGFMKAAECRKEETLLADSVRLVYRMENELSCRRTPLSILCGLAQDCRPELRKLYTSLSETINMQTMPDVPACMTMVLENTSLPESVYKLHHLLGQTFGKFDLEGQLRELDAVGKTGEQMLSSLRENQKEKLKSYQTLGLCAGAALVILLI